VVLPSIIKRSTVRSYNFRNVRTILPNAHWTSENGFSEPLENPPVIRLFYFFFVRLFWDFDTGLFSSLRQKSLFVPLKQP
jgi:hypothetical protein